MGKTNLIVVGGFLGAGKTTSIIALAKYLLAQNKKIGIVTNDQGSSLVDTNYLKSQGLSVLEVTGGCFCCNFDEFTNKLTTMQQQDYPDYILAEPVGSCTDLVATIMKPMKKGHSGSFDLSPLSVVVDPKRLKRVMRETDSPFPNEINYLFLKQLEEADIIAINKTDLLSKEEISLMKSYLKDKYKGAEVLEIQSKNDFGIENWTNIIASTKQESESLDIVYDTYAKAEADLGWLNSSCGIISKCEDGFDANEYVLSLAQRIKQDLKDNSFEIAHLKIYAVSGMEFCKLSCVSIFDDISFDKRMSVNASEISLIVNIRANADFVFLKKITEDHIDELNSRGDLKKNSVETQAFAPSYPNPVHRM